MDSFELFQIYWPHFLLCLLCGGLFSIFGTFFTAQRKVVESFYISQAAVFGGLLALHLEWPALLVSLIVAFFALYILRFLRGSPRIDKSELQISGYLLFLTLSLLLIQWSSRLKSHFIPSLFGDISLLSTSEIWQSLFISITLLLVYGIKKRELLITSFKASLLNREMPTWVHLLRIFLIVFGIKYFGLLFSLSFLFIPTTLVQSRSDRSATKHGIKCLTASSLGVFIGFPLALMLPNMQTTPTVVSCLIASSLLVRSLSKMM